jgi:hypothetical protein
MSDNTARARHVYEVLLSAGYKVKYFNHVDVVRVDLSDITFEGKTNSECEPKLC